VGTGDTGGPPADRGPPRIVDIEPELALIPSRDFRITPAHRIGEGGLHSKARDNIQAIRTLKALEAGNRDATDDEKASSPAMSGGAQWRMRLTGIRPTTGGRRRRM